jgi:HSP20 family molecular chaperone IbpA
LEKTELSAKWRRSKKSPKWFNIIKNLDEAESKNTFRAFRIENSRIRRRRYPYKYRVPKTREKRKWKEPEPLTDIFEEKEWIIIVAELTGFKKENLKIHVKDHKLTLFAEARDHKYYKSLNLPKRVIPTTEHTTYKNGVLEIRLRKAAEERSITKIAG